jgi:predicted DNA-binding transcriptional regulator AlpA
MGNIIQVYNTTTEQLTETFASILDERITELKRSFTPKEPDEYLTAKELEKVLKISSVTLWEWGKKKISYPKKIANRVYYLRSEIQELLLNSNK